MCIEGMPTFVVGVGICMLHAKRMTKFSICGSFGYSN